MTFFKLLLIKIPFLPLLLLASIVSAQGTLHVTGTGGGFETGIIIDNPLSMDWSITLTGTYPDGTVVEHNELVPGYGRFVGSAQDLFPDRMDAQGQVIRVSHIAVPTSLLFTTATYLRPGSTQTTVEPQADGEQWIIRPSGATYSDGIAFVNTGDQEVTVVIEHYDQDGKLVKSDTIAEDLAPGGKVLHVIQKADGTAYYKVKSTGKGATISLSFANDGTVIMENSAEPIEENAPTEEELEDEQGCLELETENYAVKFFSGNTFQVTSGESSGSPTWGEYQVTQSMNNVTAMHLMVQGGPNLGADMLELIWVSYWQGQVVFSDSNNPDGEREYQAFDRQSGDCKH